MASDPLGQAPEDWAALALMWGRFVLGLVALWWMVTHG